MPRVVDGIEGAVVGMAGGNHHSLVITAKGRVLAFGRGEEGGVRVGHTHTHRRLYTQDT